MKSNEKHKVIYKDPKTIRERAKVATDCVRTLKLSIPCILDRLDDRIRKYYFGFPSRTCLIGQDGKFIYLGQPGPRGVNPKVLQKELSKAFK